MTSWREIRNPNDNISPPAGTAEDQEYKSGVLQKNTLLERAGASSSKITGSEKFSESLSEQLSKAILTTAEYSFISEATSQADRPFSLKQIGDNMEVLVPDNITPNNKLGSLLLTMVSLVPNLIIKESKNKWIEPSSILGVNEILEGLRELLVSRPSFAYDNSKKTSVYKAAFFINIANKLLPNYLNTLERSVVPTHIGNESVKDVINGGLKTIETLFMDSVHDKVANFIRVTYPIIGKCRETEMIKYIMSIKIPFRTVRLSAIPHDKVLTKVKGSKKKEETLVPRSILSCHSSIFLCDKEVKWLKAATDHIQFDLANWKKQWYQLEPVTQHLEIARFKEQMASSYKEAYNFHHRILQRLGHRKQIIHEVAIAKDHFGLIKKDQTEYKLVSEFFKNNCVADLPLKKGIQFTTWYTLGEYIPAIDELYYRFFNPPEGEGRNYILEEYPKSNDLDEKGDALIKYNRWSLGLLNPDDVTDYKFENASTKTVHPFNKFRLLRTDAEA